MPPQAARSSDTSPEGPARVIPCTVPFFMMANSIETLPLFINGGLADSGIRLYQFAFTSCNTRCRYGAKSTPMVSLSTSRLPTALVACLPRPKPLSPPLPPMCGPRDIADRAACSIALPADMLPVPKLGLGGEACCGARNAFGLLSGGACACGCCWGGACGCASACCCGCC